jgi:hypothetical protein
MNLSKLIEACGLEFDSLVLDVYYNDGSLVHKRWIASGGGEPLEPYQVSGKTPEEAVSNLLIELTRK